MGRPLHELDDTQLAAALRHAGRGLPGARRDLAAALPIERAGSVSTDAAPGTRQPDAGVAGAADAADRRRPWRSRPRRVLAAAVLLLVLLAGTAVAAGMVAGVSLRIGDPGPLLGTAPLVDDAAYLGERTSLAAAREQAGFAVRVPADALAGAPQVYVAGTGPDTRVSLLYPATATLPAIGGTSAGLLVTQFAAGDAAAIVKVVEAEGSVTAIDVGGAPGWWIGDVHAVRYLDGTGRVVTERVRYADRTLLWSRDGVTFRLEADVPLAQAVELAESMR